MLRTGERSIVFDSVMQVELLQIKRISTIASVQHAGGIVTHIVTIRRAKVVSRTKIFRSVGELDASSAAWKDS